MAGRRIDADIVRIVAKDDGSERRQISCVKEPNRPVTAIGNDDHVLIGQIRDALRRRWCIDPLSTVWR
jgi:hypothetical protein